MQDVPPSAVWLRALKGYGPEVLDLPGFEKGQKSRAGFDSSQLF